MLDVEIGNGSRTQTGTKQQGGTDVTGQLRIIVLDTSPTTRKILEVILHREGHLVACFDDSLEALRALSRHGPADLLFLGLDLPKMDGFEVLKYLRGEPRFRSMGTIALLGEREGILVRLKARLAGALQVVTKPLVRQRIVALVSKYACQSASAQESNRLSVSASLEDSEVAPCPEKE
jgi:chemotaxis family two-component system response regulator PixG